MNFVNQITTAVEKSLDDNIVCLLFFGSAQQNQENQFSDLDFLLILRDLDLIGLSKLRTKLSKLSAKLDIPYIIASEIPENLTNFRIGAHGPYFALELIEAQVLLGSNPFMDKQRPNKRSIIESLEEKIVQYLTHVRRFYLEDNQERSEADYYQLTKKLDKAFLDLSRIWQLKKLEPAYIKPLKDLVNRAKQLNASRLVIEACCLF